MVPIELQQLREVQSVVSLPHISNHTLKTDFKMPQNYPIAQCVSKGAAYKTNTSIFSFYWLHSYHRLSQNSPIEATTGANCFNTYFIVQELPALVHWQKAPKQLAMSLKRELNERTWQLSAPSKIPEDWPREVRAYKHLQNVNNFK